MRVSERVVGGPVEPRRVTVTVRPKWTGALAELPHPEAFGSGFIVRWRSATGVVETRIVTNNHVMAGAFEADIVPGDRDKDHGRSRAPCNRAPAGCRDGAAWHATLVQANPHDDVAILKLDGDAASAFSEGIGFRLTPAREEEPVVAAGFPGVGVEPSFQVSRGSVSNAAFGADPNTEGAMRALVQHTAPIDPGNSGGPLLDADGQLLGMNTFKIVGRDNVGLAIPTPRIQEALLRSERRALFDAKNAEGSCNAAVAALASPHPAGEAMSRFGLSVFVWTEAQPRHDERVDYKDEVRGQPSTPVDLARLTAYAAVRAAVERERGVRPYEVCEGLKPGAERGTFVATFHTRAGKRHALVLGEEHGALRVESFE
jgi:S1-C subfamily serine protease